MDNLMKKNNLEEEKMIQILYDLRILKNPII